MLLTLPIINFLGHGISAAAGIYIGIVSLGMILGAGLQRRSWAMPYNLGLQVLVVLGFFFHPSIGFMGVVFCLVWAFILRVRSTVAERQKLGLLTSQ